MRKHAANLVEDIGERNIFQYQNLGKAAGYIFKEFKGYGYKVEFQWYEVRGERVRNIIAEKRGRKKK